MSAATDFLNHWITLGAQHAPSITVCSSQPPSNMTPGSANFGPGIVSFGWGLNGTIVEDGAGDGIGLNFSSVRTAFSDRSASGNVSWPNKQHFNNADTDPIHCTLTVEGDHVNVVADLIRWGHATWSADTTQLDGAGGQLYFPRIPGAGNGPNFVMLMAFQPSGAFNFID